MAIHMEVGPAVHLQQLNIKMFDAVFPFQSDFTEYLSHPPTHYNAQEGYVVGRVSELLTVRPNLPPLGNATAISFAALVELVADTPLGDIDAIYGRTFLPLTESLVTILETASKRYLKDWVPKPNCNGEAALWLQYWPRYVLNKYRNPILLFS